MSNYTATYYNAAGRFFQATLFISSVTITIRYRDENNIEQNVYWLEQDISSFEERSTETELQCKNKKDAVERLIIRSPELLQAIKKKLKHNRLIGKARNRLFSSTASKVILLFSIVIGFLLLGYFWFVPWLGERVAGNFSKEYEISMGEQMYQSMEGTFTIDAKKTATLNEFYSQLHYTVDYPVKITVVESKESNAFAIPGGHIVVYTAILNKVKTPEELAALLGHEASHIALRHSLKNLFRSLARKMFLSMVVGNESAIVSVVVDNADNLKGLSYSRSLETEADNSGLQLMSKSSIDTQGMVRLMEILKQENGGGEPASFLATHPVFSTRIENIKKEIAKLPGAGTTNPELKRLFDSLNEQW